MKEQIINLDIYRRSVVILQDGCIGEFEQWLKDHDNEDFIPTLRGIDWERTGAVTLSDDLDIYVISPNTMSFTVLCHELSHVTLRVLRIIGIDPVEAEEAYAYLFEYLISQVTVSDDVPSLLSKDVFSHTLR